MALICAKQILAENVPHAALKSTENDQVKIIAFVVTAQRKGPTNRSLFSLPQSAKKFLVDIIQPTGGCVYTFYELCRTHPQQHKDCSIQHFAAGLEAGPRLAVVHRWD
jgi:hypothetical protein